MTRRTVAVALGSNLGDREAHLDFAIDRLRTALDDLRASGRYLTTPVGVPGPQPDYLNAAVVGESERSAADLLAFLRELELARGRTRPHAGAPRTLDLDLILAGSEVIDRSDLQVPHPRFRARAFVLQPLAEIAPGLVDPVSGKTMAELLEALRSGRASLA